MQTLILGIVIAMICGAAGFWLRVNTKLTVVEVSALLALVAGLILPRIFSEGNLFAAICTAVSYATMCSKDRINSYIEMISVSAICAMILYFGQDVLTGVGGRLGTSAAVSVLLFLTLKSLFTLKSTKMVAKS
ncbi:MAG: hypothetical protein QM401_11500 [Bacillota bacterium]|nr:hypothetical protein [Bacillota bacterium]